MRLIDADKAKAELLAIDETIPAWPGFFDGLKTGYQSAADRLDTMSVVEERKHGHWEDIDLDTSVCSVCKNRKNTKQNTARSAALKWKIMEMTMMNKYIQQFLDDNDLQAGERFYILDKDYKKMFNKTFYINKNATGTDDILLDNNHFAIYSDTLLYLLTGIAFVKKKPFCPKYGEMVYYVTVSGYIQEVRFDTDSTLHQLLRKAGKLYRSEEEAKRYLDKDYKDLIIQEEE